MYLLRTLIHLAFADGVCTIEWQSNESTSLIDDSSSVEAMFKAKLFKRYKIKEK